MVKILLCVVLDVCVQMDFGESELWVFDVLICYGIDFFFEVFYVKFGKVYLQFYEVGLCELFSLINIQVLMIFCRVDVVCEVFEGKKL